MCAFTQSSFKVLESVHGIVYIVQFKCKEWFSPEYCRLHV